MWLGQNTIDTMDSLVNSVEVTGLYKPNYGCGNLTRRIIEKGYVEKSIDMAASWLVDLMAPVDASAQLRELFFSSLSLIKP